MSRTEKNRVLNPGSIYGPNHNDPGFFALLWDALAKYSSLPVIMGGDWNCSYSSDPLSTNLDIQYWI